MNNDTNEDVNLTQNNEEVVNTRQEMRHQKINN
jgi:hypothetical protein